GSTPAANGVSPFSSLPIRIEMLQQQLARVQTAAGKLSDAEAGISELERKKKMKENFYNNFANSLTEAHIKEQLGSSGQNANIPLVESPTPPYKDFKKFFKIFYGLI